MVPSTDRSSIEALDELMKYPQWVVWRYESRGTGKPTKVPYNPRTGTKARVTDLSTWGTYLEAEAALEKHNYDGVGFVFTKRDPFAGVDLDNCRDPETGNIEPWAQVIIDELDSYTEISPSSTGVKIFLKGNVLKGGRRKGQIEMYSLGRYFTVTGVQLLGTPGSINDRTRQFEKLREALSGDVDGCSSEGDLTPPTIGAYSEQTVYTFEPASGATLGTEDHEILQKARRAKNGVHFDQLFCGDRTGYGSASEADLALCSCLAYWTNGNRVQIDTLFRQSKLFRSKWDEKHGEVTYGEMTIDKALIQLEQASLTNSHRATPRPIELTSRLSSNGLQLDREAYHGLAGEIVRMIEPHTEADPAALLVQFLIAFGNVIGRSAHFIVESDMHYLNLFGMVVGSSSKGRKGTSWGRILKLFSEVDGDWTSKKVLSGLSSGEGLIHAVRDTESTLEDSTLENEKRLLVVESEFASTLQVLRREGNTLSAIIRQCFDSGNLGVLTKNSPLHATSAHVSIIGHITRDELLRYLNATEQANGFANRFLWVWAKRSKKLPRGGNLTEEELMPLVERLKEAVNFASKVGEIGMEADAWQLWDQFYSDLNDGAPGLFGAVTARGEALTRRLACLFALLDLSNVVRREHLEAAIAVWKYCETSARIIFGEAIGNPTTDKILHALVSKAEGLTRTEISGLWGRNKPAQEIEAALKELAASKLAECRSVPSSGRAAERWYAVKELKKVVQK